MGNKLIKISKAGLQSKLYKRDFYTNKDYEFIIGKRIIEYDMKSANLNLCRYYKLLPEEELSKIECMNKEERVVYVGKLERNDRDFSKKLSEAFKSMRMEFFIANGIVDSDILSIKRDAIFVIGKKCRNNKFKNVTFVEKNVYSSYHNLNGIEFYYNSKNDVLDVKGITNESLYQYQKFINILKRIFGLLELNKREEFTKFIKRFTEDYKNKRLSYEYYKEFKPNGEYALIQNDTLYQYTLSSVDRSVDDKLSINYNYLTYILPIIQRHYFNLRKL